MTGGEDDYLMLSGLQHFAFCRRQWALIHIEQQWAENLRTVEGNRMHERAHEGPLVEKRGELLTVRRLARLLPKLKAVRHVRRGGVQVQPSWRNASWSRRALSADAGGI